MASIEEQAGGWTIRYRNAGDKNARRYSLPKGIGKREAQRLADEIQLEVDRHGAWRPAEAPPETLDTAADKYLSECEMGTAERPPLRPASLRIYGIALRSFLAHTRGRASAAAMHSLTRDGVSAWLAALRAGKARPRTLNLYGTVVGGFWRWARAHYTDHVGAPDMPRIHVPAPVAVVAPTWAHLDAMIAAIGAAPGPDAGPARRAALVLRYTGLRASQAVGLRWADVLGDFDGLGPALRIRPENSKTSREAASNRAVPVHPDLYRLMLEWRMQDGRPADSAPVIGAVRVTGLEKTFRPAWKRTDCPPERYAGHPSHSFRKRFISALVEAGASDAAIDYLVGHSPRGIRSRHYVDPSAFWPTLTAALKTIPAAGVSAQVPRAARA